MKPIQAWLNQPDGLADSLRALCAQAGLQGKDIAEQTGWDRSRVSRIVNGKQLPTVADLETLARVCRATPDQTADLVRLLESVLVEHRDWKRRLHSGGHEAVQLNYNELHEQTSIIRSFSTVFVPGLLQTAAYARRILSEMSRFHAHPDDDVEAAVRARLQRQALLNSEDKEFEFLLAEPVLRWLLPDPAVMRGQLAQLSILMGLPNVRFGILPLGVQLSTTPQNSFDLFDEIAIVETFVGETTHTGDQAQTYMRALDLMWNEAVTGEDARALIADAATSF